MSTEQKHVPASMNMDARNFLRAINTSAQSKVVFFENIVRRLGQEVKRDFKLAALHPTSLIFEDVHTHIYYSGDITKEGHRVTVNNIKKINVVEEKKADLFSKNCEDLISAISEEDYKGAERAFTKIEMQRFRSRVIPESGWVQTRDGEARLVQTDAHAVNEDLIPQIIRVFADAVSDNVEISESQVVSGTFSETGDSFTLPVDEYTRRRIVARHMKQVAEGAHNSAAFQKFVGNLAGLVCEKKIDVAVENAAKFLREEQEFCLLTKGEMKKLVESALAAQMEFNAFIIEDVTTLMHKTNLKVNRNNIIGCWTKTAEKAQNAALMASASGLTEAKDFAAEYDLFLEGLFNEGGDINSNRAKAYVISMKVIKNVLDHIEGQEKLAEKMGEMIANLETTEPASDVVYQAEELLNGLDSALVQRVVTMDNFSQMPGITDEQPEAEEETAGEAVPLPDLGGDEGFEPDAAAAAAPAPAGAAQMQEQPVGAAAESKNAKKAIAESQFTPIEKMSGVELEEELLKWKTEGHTYLKEDGFEDCFNQLNRCIDRCNDLGPSAKALREQFEQVRDVVIEEGNDVDLDLPHDPYAGKVSLKEGAKINPDYNPLSEDLGGLDAPAKMLKSGGDASGMSELQKGDGVQKKGLGKADGRKGDGADSAEDYTLDGNTKGEFGRKYGQNETRMDDELQSKTKGVAGKGTKSVDGRDGSGAEAAGDYTLEGNKKGEFGRKYAQNETSMSDELQSKTKPISDKKAKETSGTHGESIVDRIARLLDEDFDKQTGNEHKAGGGTMDEPTGELGRKYKEGETTMGDELQDEKGEYFGDKKDGKVAVKEDYSKQTGMEKSGLKDGYLKQPKGEFGRTYKDGETSMSDENQDETEFIDDKDLNEPVKEGETAPEEVVDEKPAGEGEKAASEDQRKGPRRHVWGRKKAAIAPREMKGESKSKDPIDAIAEDVAVFYSSDDRMEEVISSVLSHMKGGEGDLDMPMGGDLDMEPGMDDMPPVEEPAEGPLGTPEGDAAFEAGEEFDAENEAEGVPPEGAPGHDEMESDEEKDAEAGAADEAGDEEGEDEGENKPPFESKARGKKPVAEGKKDLCKKCKKMSNMCECK